MKPGKASQTAVLVCAARAAAHGASPVAKFSDPTALHLLPDDARAAVERYLTGASPHGPREHVRHAVLKQRSLMMAARTVAIDEAVRAMPCPQAVILGAGLDGRAWRMAELQHTVVFEVDHPDSQRAKQQRAERLTRAAKDVRFVPVDFTRDDLSAALEAAGHAPQRPTVWIWEGVVMYLTPAQIAATLAVVQARSAAGSRLVIAYFQPALRLKLVGWVLARLGEPLRSTQMAPQMRALLRTHGFTVDRDEDLMTIADALGLAASVGRRMKHLRIVSADRA